MFKIKQDEHGGEGKENKPAYYEQTKLKASTATLSMSEFCCSLYLVHGCFFFSPPPNQFKYYLKSQPRFLSVLQHTGTAREISSLSLKWARSLLAFLFLASSVNHCVISVTQTLQQSSHTQSSERRCWRNQGLSFSGCQFPVCATTEFFPPFAGRFAPRAPSHAWLAYAEQLSHKAMKSVHNHILELWTKHAEN